MASPSSPPSERFRLDNNSNTKSLFIVCLRNGQYFLHGIEISDGLVKGDYYDDIPVVQEILPKGKDPNHANSVRFANSGSELIALVNRKTTQEIFRFDFEKKKLESKSVILDTSDVVADVSPRPPLVIGCCGKLYALQQRHSKAPLFQWFNSKKNTWESLPSPPFLSSSGYVVIEHLGLILFCARRSERLKCSFDFYSFNIHKEKWKLVGMAAKSRQDVRKQYNPYGPFRPDRIEDGKNYPIYGMAEFADGVIYSYLFRTIVTYRLRMNYKKDIFLEPPVLCHKVIYPFCPERLDATSELSEFSDAPAFCKSPFGWPSSAIRSRCISHLGDNMFCVVETADEFPEHENFQPVYIHVFPLRGEVIEMLDSTIRFVGSGYTVRAEILHCFSPLHEM